MDPPLGIVVVGLALTSACINVIPFDDPRWAASGRLETLALQNRGSMSLHVEAVLQDLENRCEAVSRDAVVVIDDREHELVESDYRSFDCESGCGGCGGARNGRPFNVGIREGDVATGFRDAGGAVVTVAPNALVLRSLARVSVDAVAAGSQLDLRWSPSTDILSLVDLEATLGDVVERWPAAAGDPGVILVEVPSTTAAGRWRLSDSLSVQVPVSECDVAECAFRVVTGALAVEVDIVE